MPGSKRLSYTNYKLLLGVTHMIGLLALALLYFWVIFYRNGFDKRFNWHIITLPLGLSYVSALQLMIFRALRYRQRKQLKLVHACLTVPTLVLASVGYWAVLSNHLGRKPIFYSLHSWMGNVSLILYLSQGMIGCAAFLWPKAGPQFRTSYMPYHVFLGLTAFVMSTATTLLGMFEIMKSLDGYRDWSVEGILTNFCGMLFAIFAILVVFTQTRPEYRRQPLVSD